jgi:uncharacterized protein
VLGHVRLRWFAAAVLVLALTVPALAGGCSSGKVDTNRYTVQQNGKTIGSQTVKIEETGKGIVYTGTETRPFAPFNTTEHRTFTSAKDLKSMVGYESSRDVPGASFTTSVAQVAGGYSFLKNDLQVFNYVPLLPQGRSVIVVEPESACTMQALLDRFLAANIAKADAYVVVPSRSAVVLTVLVERRTQFEMHLTGQGIGEIAVAFDKNSFVTSVRTAGIVIQKGSAGSLASTPYAPHAKAGSVSDVQVPTSEKAKSGGVINLDGSLYMPKSGTKPYPAVILTGEYGPLDATGAGFLSQVADSLAGQGFAVLVCARRGIPKSEGDYATHTRKTLLSDIDSQANYLINQGSINKDNISLVGYGEGGLLSVSAGTSNPYIKRVALMATPSVTMFPNMASIQLQEAAQQGSILPEEATFGQNVINGLTALVSSTSDTTTNIAGHTVFLDWMRSWMQTDPAQQLSVLKLPVLVMQGSADTVVPASQANDIMNTLSARPGGVQKLVTFEGLGHSFGQDLTEAQSIPNAQHPVVAPQVLSALGAWLKGQ